MAIMISNRLNQVSDHTGLKQFYKEDEGISMDLERGQPLLEEYYDATKTLRRKKQYQYNDDATRFNNNVRILIQSVNSVNMADDLFPQGSGQPYLYLLSLSKGRNSIMSMTRKAKRSLKPLPAYEYDAEYRLVKKKQTVSSDARTVSLINTYSW